MKKILFVLLLAIPALTFAQREFDDGIILGEGDTLTSITILNDTTIRFIVNDTTFDLIEGSALSAFLKLEDTAAMLAPYVLSGSANHDDFSDFVAAEHYDLSGDTHEWTTTNDINADTVFADIFMGNKLWFGDGNTGFHEQSDNVLYLNMAGLAKWRFEAGKMGSQSNSQPQLMRENPTSINPNIIPKGNDDDTGIGLADADQLSLIAGGVEGIRIAEGSGSIVTTLTDTTIIEEELLPDIDEGANIGSTTLNFNHIWTDSLHANWLEVNGYTKLGSDAPKIKMKKLTGTTGNTEGDITNITHGLTVSKIIGCQVLVTQSSNNLVPPVFTAVVEHEYDFFILASVVRIVLTTTNSGSILNGAITVLLTYEN